MMSSMHPEKEAQIRNRLESTTNSMGHIQYVAMSTQFTQGHDEFQPLAYFNVVE